MGFAGGLNELQARIHYQKTYIETLLNFHPSHLDNWLQEQETEFRNIAIDVSEGDKEIESQMMIQQNSLLDIFNEGQYIFYNSMLLIVYSYYESMAVFIAKKKGLNCKYAEPAICMICKEKNILLPDELKSNLVDSR